MAFLLYDTYGFPLDVTRDMAEERGLRVDEAGFEAAMQRQRTQAREARADHGEETAVFKQILEAGTTVRVVRGLRWPREQIQFSTRMEGTQPGSSLPGTQSDRRSRGGPVSIFGETGQAYRGPDTDGHHERRL